LISSLIGCFFRSVLFTYLWIFQLSSYYLFLYNIMWSEKVILDKISILWDLLRLVCDLIYHLYSMFHSSWKECISCCCCLECSLYVYWVHLVWSVVQIHYFHIIFLSRWFIHCWKAQYWSPLLLLHCYLFLSSDL